MDDGLGRARTRRVVDRVQGRLRAHLVEQCFEPEVERASPPFRLVKAGRGGEAWTVLLDVRVGHGLRRRRTFRVPGGLVEGRAGHVVAQHPKILRGKAVVRRARAFGMRILGNDHVQPGPEFLAAHDIAMVSRNELLKQSDFVTIPVLQRIAIAHKDARECADGAAPCPGKAL